LPEVSAYHHDEGGTLVEPLQRWRQGYAVAPGQALRKRAGSPAVLRLLIGRQRYKLGLLVWLLAGIAAARSRARRRGWILLTVAGFTGIAARLGVGDAVNFVAAKAIGLIGIAVGLGRPPADPETYPMAAVEVLAPGETFHGDSRGRRSTGTRSTQTP
ncbi:MAG: hypothetical protein ACOCPZ_03565, partial [Natrialbaceae archaeon]